MSQNQRPRGLYRPEYEHDACGIGAIAHLHGHRSHRTLDDALSVLVNLEHRGGKGLEKNTGDGAGVLFQVPHRFFRKEAQKEGQLLPDEGDYGVAMLFLPHDDAAGLAAARQVFERGCAECGVPLMFWRAVPVDPHDLGSTARACMPAIYQAFLRRPEDVARGQDFERRLYVTRRTIERAADAEPALEGKIFYVCSMSSRTIVYKGMLVATQMRRFYLDLNDAAVETALALVHSRYSTNTTPSWERAHPNRYLIHNGEINTLRGNVSWIRAREPGLYSPVLGSDLERVMPIINREGSDSAILDNVLEFLVMNGRPLDRAVSLMMPEPWDKNPALSERRRAYDAYQSMLMEPWDGPAAVVFTDGRTLGAALDRNGLRPARYYVTRDDRLILSSEVGAIDVEPENILRTGCLGPGEMLEVDTAHGRVVGNDEIRDRLAAEKPYADWLREEAVDVAELPLPAAGAEAPAAPTPAVPAPDPAAFVARAAGMGWHYDEVDEVVRPMAERGSAPLASMGTDAPLACLSARPRSFFDYFHQLFAQVTNPPIDALREEVVTSTTLYLGNHGNLLEDSRDACRLVRLPGPVLSDDDLRRLCAIDRAGFSVARVRATYPSEGGPHALSHALKKIAREAEEAVRAGANIVVISDRAGAGEESVPSLLALGRVHNHLIRCGVRTRADLVVETGDALSPHDLACLVGYSASGINPYLAHDCIRDLCARGELALDPECALANYDRALTAGIVSIMSKMGISTMQGYHSAQIFEILGLSEELVEKNFSHTATRVGGLTEDDLQRALAERRAEARAVAASRAPDQLPTLGLATWRPAGEEHLIDPKAIYLLQRACREGDYGLFKEYAAWVHRPGRAVTLRDLMGFSPAGAPVPLEEVEPVESIVRRFNTGAMSYGSISREAHECLAIAMNRLHGRSNTGEGGEDPARETPLPSGDSRRSAIKQVASGRFGVTSRYLVSADEIQIKMAQGAKPGEGGHLPGKKVYPWIAEVRQSTPGVGLISPPPHHDIYSIEDLAELIFDLKCANPRARVSVKLCALAGVGTIATGVAKGGADKILVSGHNGGTGAAPRDSIYHAGIPFEIGLAETQQTLLRNGLRSRVVLETDGKLMSGRDVAIAALLGAEEFGFATMPLVAMGCLMQRDCQRDTCPAGIATQDCRLRSRFSGAPEHVENFMRFVAEDLREVMAQLGFRTVGEMVGRADCLRQVPVEGKANWRANLLDLSDLLAPGSCEFGRAIPGADAPHALPEMAPDLELGRTLDATLLVPYTASARAHLTPIRLRADIANVNRCVGTLLGSEVTRQHPEGLPEGSITVDCAGSAGQSFGAFLPAGVTLNVSGDANDYFGKGLSGGVLSVRPAQGATYKFDENVIVGNVAFYGATGGRGFVNGLAGQRFCVRNSGATVVVEGVGAHGCEYMTGGVVVVLGEVGPNFAAGMSGGVAFVYDRLGTLADRCNQELVDLERPGEKDLALVRSLVEEHVRRTASPRGIKLLYLFESVSDRFVKVVPREYGRVQALVEEAERGGASHEAALQHAFDVMREG
ncbi:glutamate synthase large subunit [Olsenella sp. An290]|uniref:glutamate synthase large subunit n=1 Tax=Olsenella sp. An290 TaxID=1965625 RepID=UPI000B372F16|nr:glutamate synthase large subunit [Olsenella sp. An290]OUO35622.1 glutamate synthase large subunit [Olsenella sp. An290]